MRQNPRPAAVALPVILAVLGLVLGTLLAVSPAATAATADGSSARAGDALLGAPVVGECRTYSLKQLGRITETSAPVPCAGPHVAQTIAVLKLKGKVGASSAQRKLPTCQKALRSAVGPELDRTAYDLSFFLPTRAQIRKGARWMRCDVILYAGKALSPLPTPLVPTPLTDAVGICAVTIKGSTRPTVCAAKHNYRYTASVMLAGKKYPGAQKTLRASILKCVKRVSTPERFWAFYPTATEWRAGYREVACLSRTKA